MTESLFTEDRVSLQALANELGLDRATLIRWADHGYQGVHLKSYRLGKKRFTSHQAAQRFLAAVNGEKRDQSVGAQAGTSTCSELPPPS